MISVLRFFFISTVTIIAISSAIIYRVISGSSKGPLSWARSWWAPAVLWLAGVKLKVEGRENIDPKKYYVFISNHQSYIDIPVIFSGLPVNIHFVAKEELRKFPFIGQYMAMMGMIFIERNSSKAVESLKKAGKLISRGKSVITFPEGTRTEDGSIGRFKKGTFLLAAESGVEIVPIKINGARAVWPKERVHLTPGTITLKIGKPVPSTGISKENINEICVEMRALVEAL